MEILQYIIVRPFTLAVRLFANMFAGHILIAGVHARDLVPASPSTSACCSARPRSCSSIVLTAFELLIQALQAYIFTILTAQYIGGSLEAEH